MFKDRTDAGEKLAARLQSMKQEPLVVVALPRGGVPVAFEVAKALEAPLDVVLIRKIGAPGQPELAVGAVADGDSVETVINTDLANVTGATPDYIEQRTKEVLKEIEQRRTRYMKDRVRPEISGRTVIIIDDGIATGASIRVAIKAFWKRGARRLVVAVPVAPPGTVQSLQQEVDQVICLETPEFFPAVGAFYRDFAQTTDEDVIRLLDRAAVFAPLLGRSPGVRQ